jgi:hypothetical protein
LRQEGTFVRLDMRPIGDAGCVADGLDARNIPLDAVHIYDKCRRAVLSGNFCGERGGHDLSLSFTTSAACDPRHESRAYLHSVVD